MTLFRKALEADLPEIMRIIAHAKQYLAAQGIDQWQDGYPDRAAMRSDIDAGNAYVYCDSEMGVLGIASILFGEEPTYRIITDGAWHTKEPYATIHRVAVSPDARGNGAARAMMGEAEKLIRERGGVLGIRVDTHRENMPMRRMLEGCGFCACGVIYLECGAERIALEKAII